MTDGDPTQHHDVWRTQILYPRPVSARCPCCDWSLDGLGGPDDPDFAVWVTAPCVLRCLVTPQGDRYIQGVFQEGS